MKKLLVLLLLLVLFVTSAQIDAGRFPFLFLNESGEAVPVGSYYDKLKELQNQINQYKAQIQDLHVQEKSLKNQISYMEYQIYLTNLEIQRAETEISILGEDIGEISQRLGRIDEFISFQTEIFSKRIREFYKLGKTTKFDMFLSSSSLDNLIKKSAYLKVLEEEDRKLVSGMKTSFEDFDEQKNLLEEKKEEVEYLKAEVESKKASLQNQKAEREWLLTVTRNEESRYQSLLKQSQSELAIINQILRSFGTPVGPVSKGQVIGFIGNTGCSTGPHVHFGLIAGGGTINPKPYLDNGTLLWPLANPKVTQGYGENKELYCSWFGGSYCYIGHNGIDMTEYEGAPVFASMGGNAYRAVDFCGGHYVWIQHPNGWKTLYVHLQPPK